MQEYWIGPWDNQVSNPQKRSGLGIYLGCQWHVDGIEAWGQMKLPREGFVMRKTEDETIVKI